MLILFWTTDLTNRAKHIRTNKTAEADVNSDFKLLLGCRRVVTQIRAVQLSGSALCGVKCSSVSPYLMSLCRCVKLTTYNPLRLHHSSISSQCRFSELIIQLNFKFEICGCRVLVENASETCRKSQASNF